MRHSKTLIVGLVLILATGASLALAQPTVKNADLEERVVTGSLDATVRQIAKEQDDPAWIGYVVPAKRNQRMCCGDHNCRDCYCKLERERSIYQTTDDNDRDDNGNVRYNDEMMVLIRIEGHEIGKIRTFSIDCKLDANDLKLIWLPEVDAGESVAFFSDLAVKRDPVMGDRKRVSEQAVATVSMHEHPTVVDALESFVDPDRPSYVREDAVFWIGNVGGNRAIGILDRLLLEDRDDDIREKAIFALTLPDEPEALDILIRTARRDSDAGIRSNAIFWLSQEAGKKAADAIADAIDNDPDTDVKEQAVFALSQLPDDEGVPLLVNVARSNRNPEVREKAIFWLGQSGDERAIDFFEEILTK